MPNKRKSIRSILVLLTILSSGSLWAVFLMRGSGAPSDNVGSDWSGNLGLPNEDLGLPNDGGLGEWEASSDTYPDTDTGYAISEAEALETLSAITRLRRGIIRLWTPAAHQCGNRLTKLDKDRIAETLAFATFNAADMAAINPWGLAGVISHESRWDPCALGVTPRKWAIVEGLLPVRRHTNSYSREAVIRVLDSPRTKAQWGAKLDLGLCQQLAKYFDGPAQALLDPEISLPECAKELARRGQEHNTKTPWLYWPGKKSPNYAAKIKRWARLLGARKDEI